METPTTNDQEKQQKIKRLLAARKWRVALVAMLFSVIGGTILLNGSFAAEQPAKVYLTPASREVTPNTSFSVQLWADGGDTPVGAVHAVVRYPIEYVEYISMDAGSSDYVDQLATTGGGGAITVSRGSAKPLTGDHRVVTMHFRTLRNTTDTAAIGIDANARLVGTESGSNLTAATAGARVAIRGEVRAATTRKGDFDGDATVGVTDLSRLLNNWNTTDATTNLNGDARVSVQDLSILNANWGGAAD